MHGLRLPAHIHYGLFRGQRIFLDLATDRYFKLGPEKERLFAALENREFVDASRCRGLVDEGLLTFAENGRPIRPTDWAEPSRSLLEEQLPECQSSIGNWARVSLDLVWARGVVGRGRLQLLFRQPSCRESEPADDRLPQAIAQFQAARAFAPFEPNCLRDSLAMRRYLDRLGMKVRLVIGAKLHPFSAHCWLQHDDLVLNDCLSGARGFAPVLLL